MQIVLKTERVIVSTLDDVDAPALRTYLLDNVEHHAPWEPARDADFYELHSVKHRMEESTRQQNADNALMLAAFSQDETDLIAVCSFTNIVRGAFLACNLGYSISKAYEGKGLMFEVLSSSIDYVFRELKLHRIMANYMPQNVRSAALLSRLGFEKEGVAKSYLKIAGTWQDHVLTSKVNPSGIIP